jgi:predicted RNase H-like HicB family nuclease
MGSRNTVTKHGISEAHERNFVGLIHIRNVASIQTMKIKVVIHEAEEGGFWAEVPALPGCFTEGETREELLSNIKDAVEGCLEVSADIAAPTDGGVEEEIEV